MLVFKETSLSKSLKSYTKDELVMLKHPQQLGLRSLPVPVTISLTSMSLTFLVMTNLPCISLALILLTVPVISQIAHIYHYKGYPTIL